MAPALVDFLNPKPSTLNLEPFVTLRPEVLPETL